MSPQAISSLPGPTVDTHKSTTRSFNDLKSEDFFGLLIAQLQAQDPLKPTDNQTLMTQMSTIRQMETSSSLNNTLSQLSAEQRFGSASSLIGHYVAGEVTDTSGKNVTVQGVVTGVHFEKDGRAILELHDGNDLPADKVVQVTLVENLPQELQQQLLGEGTTPSPSAKGRPTAPIGGTPRYDLRAKNATVAPVSADDGLVNQVLKSLFGVGAGAGVGI